MAQKSIELSKPVAGFTTKELTRENHKQFETNSKYMYISMSNFE